MQLFLEFFIALSEFFLTLVGNSKYYLETKNGSFRIFFWLSDFNQKTQELLLEFF